MDRGLSPGASKSLRAALFDSIYHHGTWNTDAEGTNTPVSGPGSSADSGPVLAASVLLQEGQLSELGVTSVLDIGCGDMSWIPLKTNLCNGSGSGVFSNIAIAIARTTQSVS